jgi:glutaredoxin 3
MSRIVLYTTPFCGFCHAAKRLLARKGQEFIEIDVSGDPEKREEMVARALGGRTVPQIFIDGRHIGGYDELAALEREAKLDVLLAESTVAEASGQ